MENIDHLDLIGTSRGGLDHLEEIHREVNTSSSDCCNSHALKSGNGSGNGVGGCERRRGELPSGGSEREVVQPWKFKVEGGGLSF
ncbi:hypothetical protein C1H46_022346 [Malus baccata]|uniref:Uncharacterized protein n=1 Tax=Malus baccata TaxID=106549 RepID=A0A540LZZ6_MALBA|nr:hypothetical protein C1H46_022346 [Malus baccata]